MTVISRLADARDLLDPSFGRTLLDKAGHALARDFLTPRKSWEQCWIAQAFEDLGLPGSVGAMLGLGVGNEPLSFHFAGSADIVHATDQFSDSSVWGESRFHADALARQAPFTFPRDRLRVRDMDMRTITFPDQSIDAVWSCSSIEHVATIEELYGIFSEIHRVLKPGGVAILTTEFSLNGEYFLPGVLSLWPEGIEILERMGGLEFVGAVDLSWRSGFPGNRPIVRRDHTRGSWLRDVERNPSGLVICTGYTQLIPIGLALRKTGRDFEPFRQDWLSPWYRAFSRGMALRTQERANAECGEELLKALELAPAVGPRAHCLRWFGDVCLAAKDSQLADRVLKEIRELPDDFADDDALWPIGHMASMFGDLELAHRCWDLAADAPGVLHPTRFAIRLDQLVAELAHGGCSDASRRRNAIAEAALVEALHAVGGENPTIVTYRQRLLELQQKHDLQSYVAPAQRRDAQDRAFSPACR